MIDYGSIARYYRLLLGFRQKDLVGVFQRSGTRSTYTYKELGATSFSLDELLSLAAVFKIPPRAFCYPELCQWDKTGKRTRRHGKEGKPLYISDLSPKERELIAQYRIKGISG